MSGVARLEFEFVADEEIFAGGEVKHLVRIRVAIGRCERARIDVNRRSGGWVRCELLFEIDVRNLIGQAVGIACADVAQRDDGKFLLRKAQKLSAVAEQSAAVLNDG